MVSLIRQRARERADVRRRRLARSYSALHLQVEKSALRSLGGFYASLTRAILARVDAIGMNGFSVDEIFVPHDHRGDFLRTMRPAWQRAIGAGIEFESQILGDAKQSLLLARKGLILQDATSFPSIHVDLSPDLQRKVREFLQERERGVWSHVSATMHDRLRRAIQKGVKDGETFDTMRERLQASLKGMSDAQGLRIARTETTGSLNAGQQWEREEIGVEHKSWVATIDDLVRGADPKDRFNHLAADGQIVENGKPFSVSGQQLMFPGDSSKGASAGNVICCRCAGVSEFVDKPRRVAAPVGPSQPRVKPPDHLTHTGPQTEFSRKIWAEIGDGIKNEGHARRVGSMILDVIKTKTEPALKRLDDLERSKTIVTKSLADAIDAYESSGGTRETFLRKWDLEKAAEKITAEIDAARDTLGKQWLESMRDAMGQIRDFGHTSSHQYVGGPRFIQTLKAAERDFPTDWLKETVPGRNVRLVSKKRGYFDPKGSYDEIAIEKASRADTATHELVHLMEYRLTRGKAKGILGKLEREFLARRAGNERKSLIYTPRRGKPEEWGYRDQFTNHYIGKDYGYQSEFFEILSMGWEGIIHDKHRIRTDEDLVRFVLGVFAGI